MKHYEITRWADYVRGLEQEGDDSRMGEHLESGCARCEATVMALRSVKKVAEEDSAKSVPDYAVRSVKALFSLNRPGSPNLLERLQLRPVFDSALVPAEVGVRGAAAAAGEDRHMVYVAEEFALDLTVERQPDGAGAVVAGQLLEPEGGPLANIPAFLVSGGAVAATAVTGEEGSFRLESGLGGSCELLFFADDERTLAVVWEQEPTSH